MIVCVCQRVSDKAIRKLVIEEGISEFKEIRRCTALGSQCGKCVRQAKYLINDLVAQQYRQAG